MYLNFQNGSLYVAFTANEGNKPKETNTQGNEERKKDSKNKGSEKRGDATFLQMVLYLHDFYIDLNCARIASTVQRYVPVCSYFAFRYYR